MRSGGVCFTAVLAQLAACRVQSCTLLRPPWVPSSTVPRWSRGWGRASWSCGGQTAPVQPCEKKDGCSLWHCHLSCAQVNREVPLGSEDGLLLTLPL